MWTRCSEPVPVLSAGLSYVCREKTTEAGGAVNGLSSNSAALWALLLVLLSAVQLGVGAIVGRWLPAQRARRRETALARECLGKVQDLSAQLTDRVARHSDQVAAINDELIATEGSGITLASAADRLLAANRELSAELESLRRDLAEQSRRLEAQTAEARTDALTGLLNRRAFDEELGRRFAQWRRQHTPVAVVMVDVDHFKRFNDTHGHQAGDEVLRRVAGALRATMRDMDVVARYGGEEFALILPGTGLREARRAAERARMAIEGVEVLFQGKPLKVTASLGTAQAMPGDEPASLVSRADQALYAAKKAGRNRVYYHSGSECLPGGPDTAAEPAIVDSAAAAVAMYEATLPPAGEASQPAATEAPGGRGAERRKHERRAFPATQSVAPFTHGRLPTPAMFREVQCADVSSSGFSFITDERPSCESVVVEFGVPPNLMYLSAKVVHTTASDSPEGTRYKVGCRFSGRLQL
jgi:diguanylate cyclase